MQPLKGRSEALFIISCIFLVVPLLFVALRCFTRSKIIKYIGWDDWTMVIAMILQSWFTVCEMIASLYGLGRDEQDFTVLANIDTAIMWWWLGQTAYLWGAAFARTSLVLSLLSLTIHRRRRFILYAVVSFSWMISIGLWLLFILACRPTSQFWEQTNPNACLQPSQLVIAAYVQSIVASICDFTLGAYPIPLIWGLQMSMRTKALLGLTLCIGFL
ncbi:uncharacterized protein N7477_009353 [Penicillium maclennaniae]|uniref:uncharacterized protein n=1 Tax=Penicillium maclennaniae TaxID=1343394 RepID=UPI002540CBC7|nr:uncharacterized protein N7477_009353 [Penicillium maclennaniae]KAJ5661737.1 hypothetical protein N7477_009353 [Penicillium maclennaniae]